MKMKVLVFRTSISGSDQVNRLTPLLDELMDINEKWNVDLEDCDNILRVEAISLHPAAIIENLQLAGVSCEELED
ncbi:MAG: hypothetical protein WKF35_02675 [Ferruginibacter sp.]